MILLDQTFFFHPDDDKSNYCIPFTLKEDFLFLRYECQYSPKIIQDRELSMSAVHANIGRYVPRYQLPQYAEKLKNSEDLVNLLTLSLDYQYRYLGCAHRHAAHQIHHLSKESSSPGFIRHQPKAGDYRAVINIHSITSPEVAYHLTITASNEEE